MKSRAIRTMFVLFAVNLAHKDALGGFTILNPTNQVWSAGDPSNPINVSLYSMSYLGSADSTFQSTLSNSSPGWTFNYASGGLSGTLDVSTYNAVADGGGGGAVMSATYTGGPTDPATSNLYGIQMISTSAPISPGGPSNYIDPYNNTPESPSLPFYWDINNYTTNSDSSYWDSTYRNSDGSYGFTDTPHRPDPGPPGAFSSLSWSAELFLASWDGTLTNGVGTITIYDGVGWGFYIQQYPGNDSPAGSGGIDRSPVPVPEPSGVVLWLTAGMLIFARRSYARRGLTRSRVLGFSIAIGMGILHDAHSAIAAGDDAKSGPGPRGCVLVA
ncbi:MAG TPA: hypothetical protein VGH33_13485, partial [Isosphaeraceae bacterium]